MLPYPHADEFGVQCLTQGHKLRELGFELGSFSLPDPEYGIDVMEVTGKYMSLFLY